MNKTQISEILDDDLNYLLFAHGLGHEVPVLLRGGGHLEDGAWSALQRVTTIQTFVRKEAILESGRYINVQLRSSTRYSRVLLVVGWRHVPPTWDLERRIFVCRSIVNATRTNKQARVQK